MPFPVLEGIVIYFHQHKSWRLGLFSDFMALTARLCTRILAEPALPGKAGPCLLQAPPTPFLSVACTRGSVQRVREHAEVVSIINGAPRREDFAMNEAEWRRALDGKASHKQKRSKPGPQRLRSTRHQG